DLETGVETWSEETYRLIGSNGGEPLTLTSFLEYVHEEDRQHLTAAVERAIRDRHHYDCEFRVVNQLGEMRVFRGRGRVDVDAAGKSLRLVGTTQDITEQKQMALEMQTLSNSLEAEREILKMLASGSILDQILEAINTNIDFLWPTAFCAIQLLDSSR